VENPGGSQAKRIADKYYIFVSSWTVDGSINPSPYVECAGQTGLARADCACGKAAEFNNLRRSGSHQFYAWLSINSTPGPQQDAICRLTQQATVCTVPAINQPWYNTQGQVVAANLNNFATATLSTAVRYTESGADMGPDFVWTSTGTAGTALNTTGSDCSSWTSTASSTGSVGNRIDTGTTWTSSNSSTGCGTGQRIYCIASPTF